jgi:signal transduction histidine kinase
VSILEPRLSRALLKASVAALAVAVVVVGWLGWRLLQQDRALEHDRVQARLEDAADLVAAALGRHLTVTNQVVARMQTANDDARSVVVQSLGIDRRDAVALAMTPDGVWSSSPLIFYPGVSEPVDLAEGHFADAERLEFNRDLRGALASLQPLTRTGDVVVHAGALVRVGRIASSLGDTETALATFDRLTRLGSVSAAGRPADLIGTFERCSTLHAAHRDADLRVAAAALDRRLWNADWRLSRGQFYFYVQSLEQWFGDGSTSAIPDRKSAAALATGASALWREMQDASWQAVGRLDGSRLVETDAGPVLVTIRTGTGRATAFVATREFVSRTWFPELQLIADRQRVRVSLVGMGDGIWWGQPVGAGIVVRRPAGNKGVPFAISVEGSDPAGDASMLASRRRLLAGLLATLALVIVTAGYTVARGVVRELDIARLQSEFVGAVSHEFRTPVASVRQLSELLDEGRVPDESRRAYYFSLLRRESERLQRLVEGLLDFGRMESAAKVYRFETTDAEGFVREVTDEFASGLAGDRGRLSLVASDGPLPIRVDREAMGRALWNLLENAVKYSPANSPIEVVVRRRDGQVAIDVVDKGSGIPPAEQGRIFEKFVRGADAVASGARGTGLGLTMVRHIVRAHRGDVRLKSEVGRGSTFTITIPVEGQSA